MLKLMQGRVYPLENEFFFEPCSLPWPIVRVQRVDIASGENKTKREKIEKNHIREMI